MITQAEKNQIIQKTEEAATSEFLPTEWEDYS